MADRYQNGHIHSEYGDDPRQENHGSDPLAELARLIGQNDPLADFPNAGRKGPPRLSELRAEPRAPEAAIEPQNQFFEEAPVAPAGPPSWLQRRGGGQGAPAVDPYAPPSHGQDRAAAPQEARPAFLGSHRSHPMPETLAPSHYAGDQQAGRYDDTLYGHAQHTDGYGQHGAQESHYHDDHYDYDEDDGYSEKKRGGFKTIAAILALAVVGTGGAYAYRTFSSSAPKGEPPVIRADSNPIKVVPPTEANAQAKPEQERLAGVERIVPREEQPVDVSSKAQSGPRVVFPPLTQSAAPVAVASTAPNGPSAHLTGNGTLSSGPEPRRIRTVPVRSDQPDAIAAASAAPPPAAQRPAAPARPAAAATQDTPMRTASINPTAATPAAGGYVVQVSSQRSEADARASFRVLQGKFPTVLRGQQPMIKKVDLGSKGIYYRAMVGPFASADEATNLCGNMKSAGGQCIVQRN